MLFNSDNTGGNILQKKSLKIPKG